MKALVIQRPGAVELGDVGDPEPDPGWARVHVCAAAICMTDFELLRGAIEANYPLIPGHEWGGVVDAVGSASDEIWIGRRVVGDNELTCLECPYCRRGEWRRCPQFRQIGFQAPGAYAEYPLVPVRNLCELPDAVSFEQGLYLSLLALPWLLPAMAQCRAGSTAVILGVGPIDLNCLTALKTSGAIRVLCLDLRKSRLEFALSWGAAAVFDDPDALADAIAHWHPEGADIVVDTTGNTEIVRRGISLARLGGTFVLAGYCGGKSINIRISVRNVRILGAGNNCGFTAVAARCAAAGLLQTETMIAHRFGLEDYRFALSLDTVSMSEFVKAVLIP